MLEQNDGASTAAGLEGAGAECHVLVSRLPFLDRSRHVWGYEIQVPSGESGPSPLAVLLDLGIETLTGGRQALVRLQDDDLASELPSLLPERAVLVVPQGGCADGASRAALQAAHKDGRCIVADWRPGGDDAPLSYASLAHVTLSDVGTEDLAAVVKDLARRGVEVAVSGVDDVEDKHRAQEAGCTLFAGRWVSRPEIVEGRRAPASQLSILRLLGMLNDPETDFAEIEDIVSQDVALSYRIVRTVNSASFALNNQVETISQAVVMLGLHRLKTWVTLLSLSGVEGKPSELMVTAMLRAAHCERVARMTGHETPDTLFTAGLFSVLDALLDLPMWEILEGLNLSDELSGALSDGAGEAGSILRCVRAHEEARWDDVEYRSLSVTEIMGSFLESVVWADETLATLDRVDSAD